MYLLFYKRFLGRYFTIINSIQPFSGNISTISVINRFQCFGMVNTNDICSSLHFIDLFIEEADMLFSNVSRSY